MSHLVTIQTEIRDAEAVAAACRRLQLPVPVEGVEKLYSGEAHGLLVQLPEWRYRLAINTQAGSVQFDNFGGAWGKQEELDAFMQAYAVEKASLEARKMGHTFTEQALEDGSIKLTITESW
jgi:hypothetical protein